MSELERLLMGRPAVQRPETQRATEMQPPVATPDPNAWLVQAVSEVAPKPSTEHAPTGSELIDRAVSPFEHAFIVRRSHARTTLP